METNEKTLTVTYPERDVENKIKEYLGESARSVNVVMVGRMACVNITYEDFKPVRRVRRDIEDMIPNVEIEHVERLYSKDRYLKVIEELSLKNVEIYVKESDESLKKTNFALLLEEELMFRSFEG